MEEDELLPVYLIKRYHFCPRTVYFEQVLGYKERQREYMIEGKELHESEEKKLEKRKNVFPYSDEEIIESYSNIELSSSKLGIKGVVDTFVKTKKGNFLIERKHVKGFRRPSRDHLYQAVAYAMLIEENLGVQVHYIVIHYLKNYKIFKVKIDDQMRKHVIWTIERIKEIIEKSYLYPYKKLPYCEGCGFLEICKKMR